MRLLLRRCRNQMPRYEKMKAEYEAIEEEVDQIDLAI